MSAKNLCNRLWWVTKRRNKVCSMRRKNGKIESLANVQTHPALAILSIKSPLILFHIWFKRGLSFPTQESTRIR